MSTHVKCAYRLAQVSRDKQEKNEKKKEMKNGSDIGAVFVSCAHNFQVEDSQIRPHPFFCFQSEVVADERKYRLGYSTF